MFCRYCGTQNPDDSLFCKKCGKNLEDGTKEPSPPAKEPAAPLKEVTPKEKKRSSLPIVLGITIPVIAVLVVVVLILTGIIPFPFFNQERTAQEQTGGSRRSS